MTPQFEALIEAAKQRTTTAQERETQRRSFAYGNTAYENADITREMIDREADKIAASEEE